MIRGRKIWPLLAAGIIGYVYFFFFWSYDLSTLIHQRISDHLQGTDSTDFYSIRSPNGIALHECHLKEYADGWSGDAINIVDQDRDRLENCDRSFKPLTQLVDGRVRVVEFHSDANNVACRARSVLWKHDLDYNTGMWKDIEMTRFTSDGIHVQCAKKPTTFKKGDIFYSFVHQQIYRNPKAKADAEIEEREKSRPRPNVHIILLDSIGNSAMRRLLPRTVAFMKGEFGAVEFRHLNKVGENSRPNGVAFLLGKQFVGFDRSLLRMPSVPPDFNSTFFCNSLDLDQEKMVIREFQKQRGYVTLISDDWSQGVFNYPNCRGFQKMPVTHYNRPFLMLREDDELAKSLMSEANCMPIWHSQLDYLQQFVNTYPDRPKASLTWITSLAHDDNDDAFAADDTFFDFLSNNRAEFNKSILFFMSDHGIRWGRIAKTPIGEAERNSAFLMISVPGWIRKEKVAFLYPKAYLIVLYKSLLNNMRLNADKLITHFDVHATFLDLVETLPESNFASFSALPPNPELRGSSLFRPLPEGPRNCFTLPIPFEYCTCTMEYLVVRDKSVEAAAAQETVTRINEILKSSKLETLCHAIKSATAKIVKAMKGTDGLFLARVVTKPGNGEFEVWLRDIGPRGSPFFVPGSASFARVNEYGHDADCLLSTGFEDMRPYCYCKGGGSGRQGLYDQLEDSFK